jgi:hypothetical protein
MLVAGPTGRAAAMVKACQNGYLLTAQEFEVQGVGKPAQ